MTPSDLKRNVERCNPDSCFFTRPALRFLGDTMKNYGCRKAVIFSETNSEGVSEPGTFNKIVVWELYRKQPVKHNIQSSVYFHPVTFKRVYESRKDYTI